MQGMSLVLIFIVLGCACKSSRPAFERRTSVGTEAQSPTNQADSQESGEDNEPVTPVVADKTPTPETKVDPLPLPFEAYTEGRALSIPLTLADPIPWRVFQRQTRLESDLRFTTTPAIPTARFVRSRLMKDNQMVGADWQTFEAAAGLGAGTSFTFKAPAGGWYALEVIAYDENRKILGRAVVDRIGVGEVFLVSGQSNSSNCGAPRQTSASGLVASTNGAMWKQANDPQIGAADEYIAFCQNGSNWPRTGDRLTEKYKVPIAFASTGHSGTTVAHWLPGASNPHSAGGAPPILYNHLKARAQQLGKGGFRAVLWHQGENDTVTAPPTTSNQYYQRMTTIMTQLETDMGQNDIRWAVAQASWCKDGTYPQVNNGLWGESPAVRDAQSRLWQLAKVYPGPDTDLLKDDTYRRLVANNARDCHFSGLGLQTVGDMWFDRISVMLDELVK